MLHIPKFRAGRFTWLVAIAMFSMQFLMPVPAAADFSHEVVSGDTFWDIAVKYDISLTELLEENGLSEDDILSVGVELTIPSEYDFDYTLVTEHKVRAGECLGLIADEYGVSVKDICSFNGLEADDAIYLDQVLTIPPRDATPAITRDVDEGYYIVVPGDSAWLIARKYDVSVGALLTFNGLSEDSILTVGQRLKMPPIAGRPVDRGFELKSYTVRPGDCLGTIAEKHDISVAVLCETNRLGTGDYIHPGQVLRVPVRPDKPSAEHPAKTRPPMVVMPDHESYDGGPLPPIGTAVNSPLGEAMKEGTSVFDFTSRQDEFSISGYFDGNDTYYRIESSDCISYIADCFELTVDEICLASNLTNSDYIIPGQIIKIPGEHDVSTLHTYKEEYANAGGRKLLESCLEYLGLKYVYGGVNLSKGVDCSGLIWAIVKRDHGIKLPRSAKDLSRTDYGIPVEYDALQEGDLIFFHTTRPGISHVGVYMGNGKFVHASSAGGAVVINRVDTGYYKERFIKALRLNFL